MGNIIIDPQEVLWKKVRASKFKLPDDAWKVKKYDSTWKPVQYPEATPVRPIILLPPEHVEPQPENQRPRDVKPDPIVEKPRKLRPLGEEEE